MQIHVHLSLLQNMIKQKLVFQFYRKKYSSEKAAM